MTSLPVSLVEQELRREMPGIEGMSEMQLRSWADLAKPGCLGTFEESQGTALTNRQLNPTVEPSWGNDIQAAIAFALRHRAQVHTFQEYELCLYRLQLFAVTQRNKAVSALGPSDLIDFGAFLFDPPQELCRPLGEGRRKRNRDGLDRYPFAAGLAFTSVVAQLGIVSRYFDYLVQKQYLVANRIEDAAAKLDDLAKLAQASTSDGARMLMATPRGGTEEVTRYLTPAAFDAVEQVLAEWSAETWQQHLERARARFLVRFMYLTACRVSDIVKAHMGDVQLSELGHWAWRVVVGKGGKAANVPVTTAAADEFKAYRLTFGFTPVPPSGDMTPLAFQIRVYSRKDLPALAGDGHDRLPAPPQIERSLTRQAIHAIMKDVGGRAAVLMESSPGERTDLELVAIQKLRDHSAHWWRHTRATRLSKKKSLKLEDVANLLRHSDTRTTRKYYVHHEVGDLVEKLNEVDSQDDD